MRFHRAIIAHVAFATAFLSIAASAFAGVRTQARVGGTTQAVLPNGQFLTVTAAPGSTFQTLSTGLRADRNADANGGFSTALSPDGKTLLVTTTGFNAGLFLTSGSPITAPYLDPATGRTSSMRSGVLEWIFIYDVTSGQPVKVQEIAIPSSYAGVAWDPSGKTFYVSGGADDRIYAYKHGANGWIVDPPLPVLNHNSNDSQPQPTYDGGILKNTPVGRSVAAGVYGLHFGALTAGIAVSADGKQLYAVNMFDDSVSVIDAKTRKVTGEARLFVPGSTTPKGEYPYWVTPHAGANGATDKGYVSSIRDGQVIMISTSCAQKVIPLGGEPGRMLLSRDGTRVYVANPDLDEIDVIDTTTDSLHQRISVLRPGYRYRGANPNSLALSANGATLYATLGGENAIAVIDVASGRVLGRIPTAWYPTSVSLSADGTRLFIVNLKSNSGPNPSSGATTPFGLATNTTYRNEFVEVLQKGGLQTVPIPDVSTLGYLSAIVDANNGFYQRRGPSPMMAYLHKRIKHIIYIMKENRSYDQMLGDLSVGNGDPRLTLFTRLITPNLHALAEQFVDLDNFYVSGDNSGDGWNWSWQGHANDWTEETVPPAHDGEGFDFPSFFGTPHEIDLALPLFARSASPELERITTVIDPSGSSTILPGTKDISATVGADDDRPGQTGGYLWDTVLRAGLSVRHYGLWDDNYQNYGLGSYTPGAPFFTPIVRNAAARHIVQGVTTKPALVGRTDPYFRGWDLKTPDEYRYEEWKREFDGFVRNGNLPNLEVMTFMMDHTGEFKNNVAHLETPMEDEASGDHAVGELVNAVSHSPYWKDTAIFILEDDAINGPDHIDAHRSPGYVISPYVAHNGVVHTLYNTDSIVRTIEDILGVDYLGFNDANATSMDDAFSTQPDLQPYNVIIPGILCGPPVDPTLVPDCYNPLVRKTRRIASLHGGPWWAEHTRNLVFDRPDANDPAVYNDILWRGIVGDATPYPLERDGTDLSQDRAYVLSHRRAPVPTQ